MKQRRHKRKTAYAPSVMLRRRFYLGAAIATLVYVALSLVMFHTRLSSLPYELSLTWAVFLMCYTSFKEVLRWYDVEDDDTYRGELWAAILLGGAAWMIVWNILRSWVFGLPKMAFPEDYESATIETIVLYTLSAISSFVYKYNKIRAHPAHAKVRGRISRPKANALSSPAPALAEAKPIQNPKVEVVLTKSPPPDNQNSTPKNG